MQDFDSSALMYNDDMTRKCFVAHSYDSPSQDALLAACAEVLPNFNLEPWYACYFSEKYQKLEDIHFDAQKSPLEKVVEMIANARYGIYDLTMWEDQSSVHQARNVLIELGIAIGLNRPALLLRHNGSESMPLPKCFEGLDIVEFSGNRTLKQKLKEHIPTWVNVPPEQDWSNRYCKFGQLKCEYREHHPRAKKWEDKALSLFVFDGQDKDAEDFRSVVSDILGLYSDLEFDFTDNQSIRDGFNFALCTTCQFSRTGDISLYRLTPNTPPEAFIAIGIAIAQERYFGYEIPMIFIARNMQEVPNLLNNFEIQLAENDLALKTCLRLSLPMAMNQVRKTIWRPTSLPFAEPLHNDLSLVKPETKDTEIGFVENEEELPAIARLIELGRQQTYVTLDDIISFFPEAENDVNQLEEAFAALLSAGIPFKEEGTNTEPNEIKQAQDNNPDSIVEPKINIAKSQLEAVLVQLNSQRPSNVWRGMEQVRQWLKEDPENSAVYGLLLDAVQKNHELREQVRNLLSEMMQSGSQSAEKAMLSLPSSVTDFLADADDAYYAAEYEKAIQLYRQVLKLDPENTRAQDHIAKAEIKRIAGASSTDLPREAQQYYRRARSYIAARDFNMAVSSINTAIEVASKKGMAYPDAEELLRNVYVLITAHEFQQKAKIAEKNGQRKEAISLYNQAISLDPSNQWFKKELEDLMRSPIQRFLRRLLPNQDKDT